MYNENLLSCVEKWQGLDFNTTQVQMYKSSPQEGFGMWRVNLPSCLAGHRVVQWTQQECQERLTGTKDKLMGKDCSLLCSQT